MIKCSRLVRRVQRERRNGNALEIQAVWNGSWEMAHDVHADPPVRLRGVVTRVWPLGHNGVREVIQHGRDVALATVAVRAHQGHVVLEMRLPIILLHVRGCLSPQLLGCRSHNVACQDPCSHDKVPRLDDGHFDPPCLHLVPEAVGEGFHAVFRDAVRRAQSVSHPAVHARNVHHTTCNTRVTGSADWLVSFIYIYI